MSLGLGLEVIPKANNINYIITIVVHMTDADLIIIGIKYVNFKTLSVKLWYLTTLVPSGRLKGFCA